jgi:hypothetical protein
MDYVVAILKALENLGTDRSIPYVEQLIKPHAWNITDQNIHEAAKECLAALMLRRESGRRGDGLLRAAAMNPEENLLRPIKHRPEGEVDQLLHPAPEPPGSTPDENQPDANQ